MADASDHLPAPTAESSTGSRIDDDAVLDAMIKECDGDVRAAALSLLRINRSLMGLRRGVSRGFLRGRWD